MTNSPNQLSAETSMNVEKRQHPRFNPKGLSVKISITPPPPKTEMLLTGTILDMSYTGIKIRLDKSLPGDLPISEIKIKLTLPVSGLEIAIHGMIKHLSEDDEYGIQYSSEYPEHRFDDLMFECIKTADTHIQHE